MAPDHPYEVIVSWIADRKGTLSSPALRNPIEVATPPQFAKGIEGVWSPEHLFVGAIATCVMTTFLEIADNSKLEFQGFNVKATGKLEVVGGKLMVSEVTLMPAVTVESEQAYEKAVRILNKTENNCLISNSIKSKVFFIPEVKVG